MCSSGAGGLTARIDAVPAWPQWDAAPLTTELHIDTTQTVGGFSDSTWGAPVAMLLVRTPGCYGLQLDSEPGTSTIVVRALGAVFRLA